MASPRWLLLMLLPVLLEGKEELHIGGLFPLAPGWWYNLGNRCLQAALLAVKHINNDTSVLGDYELVLDYNDTRGSTGVAMDILISYLINSPPKLAIVGAFMSEISKYTAEVSGLWNLIQMSYGSTTPVLTNREKFPYFFRTISSANDFIPVRMAIMKKFGWNRVAVLTEQREPYAGVTNSLLKELQRNNFKVVTAESFQTDPSKAVEQLKIKEARVIFGNFYEATAKKVFCEAYKQKMYGPKYVWFVEGYYAPRWYDAGPSVTCTQAQMEEAAEGYFTVVWSMMNPDDDEVTISGMTARQFRHTMNGIFGENIFPPGFQYPPANAYDAVWAVAMGLNASIEEVKPLNLLNYTYKDPDMANIFRRNFHRLDFTGVTGRVTFTDEGDMLGTLLIEHFTNGTERTIATYEGNTVNWLETSAQIWVRNGGEPPADNDDTKIVYVVLHVDTAIFYTYCAFSTVGVLLAIAFLVFNVAYRNLRLIKMSSPNLNNMIILGCVVTFIAVMLLGMDHGVVGVENTVYVCEATPWVLSLGFTLAFGAMFSKTWRVYTIFTNKTMKKMVIKDWKLSMVVVVLLAIDLVILTCWQVIDPLQFKSDMLSEMRNVEANTITKTYIYRCESVTPIYWTLALYVWKGLLLIFGIFLTWQTRNVSIPGLNDSRYIGMAIYNVVIFSVIGAPLSHILANDPSSQFAIISGFLIFCTITVLCLVFIPKILKVHRGEDGTVRGENTISGGVQGTSVESAGPSTAGRPVATGSQSKSALMAPTAKVAPAP